MSRSCDQNTVLETNLFSLEIESATKELFVSVADLDWTQAKLACENFGMELYRADSEAEDEIFRSTLNTFENTPETLHVGITSKRSDAWYSAYTGETFGFEFHVTETESKNDPKSDCMLLKKVENVYIYENVACITKGANFVCQKID